MTTAKVAKGSLIRIPKEILKKAGIRVGDELLLIPKKDSTIEIKKKVSLARILPIKVKTKGIKDVHEWREIAKKTAMERT